MEGREKLETACTEAIIVFLKQTRSVDTAWKLITSPSTNFHTAMQMKENHWPPIRDLQLFGMAHVHICFFSKIKWASFGENPMYIFFLYKNFEDKEGLSLKECQK